MKETILSALNWRSATKVFDPTKKVSDDDMHTILESARLAPSVVGLEPWKFILVGTPEIRAKLRAVGYDQSKITDAAHLVVIAQRTDAENLTTELVERTAQAQGTTVDELTGLRDMAAGSIASHTAEGLKSWLAAQTYIPLGMMIETAALLGIDAGPMEGFDAAAVDEILGLPTQQLHVVTMIAFGYRGEDSYGSLPKARRAYDDVVIVV